MVFIRLQSQHLEDPKTSYVNAIYFIFMTASSVGYGDSDIGIDITDNQEVLRSQYLVVILYVYLLQVFFSYLQMTLLFMFEEWHRIYNRGENSEENLNDWLALRNRARMLKSSFEKKISLFFKFIGVWDVENTVKSDFYRRLDEKDQHHVADYIGKKIAEKFRFFDDFSEVNKAELAFSSKVVK